LRAVDSSACYYTQPNDYEAKPISTEAQQTLPRAKVSLTAPERRVVGALAAIYATRMLGLFLLLPVLAIYAAGMPDSTPVMVGIAMGAYGMTQALLQIPFGRWSDRFGRRPLIVVGLSLFFAGSVVGALSKSLLMIILARSLQGAGAMSAAVTALLADFTREAVRTRAMAFIGISIGASFVISLIAAPVLEALIGVSGIFWLMAFLAVMGLVLLRFAVPRHGELEQPAGMERAPLQHVALMAPLRPYFVGVFALHFILTATFLSVPFVLLHRLKIAEAQHWKVYLGVFLTSFIGTVPLILAAERVARPQRIVALAIIVAALAQATMALQHGIAWLVFTAFALFFAGFNFLEARMPAGLSRLTTVADRVGALWRHRRVLGQRLDGVNVGDSRDSRT